MKVAENTPIWVTLAFGNVPTRKMAVYLIGFTVLFTVYCIPWMLYFKQPMVKQWLLLDDWSWFLMMLPMTIWYWMALRWVDQHQAW